MSRIMLKMLADMAGVSPDEIQTTMTQITRVARDGVIALENIEARLQRIEKHLGIDADGSDYAKQFMLEAQDNE